MTELAEEYRRIHKDSPRYGSSGMYALGAILPHVRALRPASIVDYGCGKSRIVELIGRRVGASATARFDPAIPGIDTRPEGPFDLVMSIDVLEHIPPEDVDGVLADMAALAKNAILVIDLTPAETFLSDGRNAHLSLFPADEWQQRIARRFPGVRPIKIRRKARAAFKTFDAASHPLVERTIAFRERWLHKMRRLASAFRPK